MYIMCINENMHTSPFKKLRSVWQMEVKSSLTRTSSRPGGATSTSSITSGSPGPHATAAARRHQGQPLMRTFMADRGGRRQREQGGEWGGRKKKLQATPPLHLMGFPRVSSPFVKLPLPLDAMARLRSEPAGLLWFLPLCCFFFFLFRREEIEGALGSSVVASETGRPATWTVLYSQRGRGDGTTTKLLVFSPGPFVFSCGQKGRWVLQSPQCCA